MSGELRSNGVGWEWTEGEQTLSSFSFPSLTFKKKYDDEHGRSERAKPQGEMISVKRNYSKGLIIVTEERQAALNATHSSHS